MAPFLLRMNKETYENEMDNSRCIRGIYGSLTLSSTARFRSAIPEC